MKVDESKVRTLYGKNKVAQAMLDYFAKRTYDATETKVDRIIHTLTKDGTEISRGQILEVFKELERMGCGNFVTGRRGWPSRFVWDVGIVSLGKMAGGESAELQTNVVTATGEEQAETLMHSFHLRPDLEVKIELPADLTSAEASRLSEFIKAIPFIEEEG